MKEKKMKKNRKRSLVFKGIIIFAILLSPLYFTSHACRGADSNEKDASLIKMHYDRGIKFYKKAEYDKAIREFNSVLYFDPDHAKAKKYLDASIKRKNKKIVTKLYKEADAYYKQKEYQKALDSYEEVLRVIPDDGYALYKIEIMKAKIEKQIRLDKSVRYAKRAEELEKLAQQSKETEIQLVQAVALDKIEKEKAVQDKEDKKKLEEAILEERRKSDITKDLEELEESVIDEKEVLLPAIKVTKEEPKKAEAPVKLTKAEPVQKEVILPGIKVVEKEEAVAKELARAKKTAPKKESVLLKEIKVLEKEQKALAAKKVAEERARKAAKIREVKSLYKLGKQHYAHGDYEEAISVFDQVMKFDNEFSLVYKPYAKKYLEKANNRLEASIRKDNLQDIQDADVELMDQVIATAAATPKEAVLGTEIRAASAYTAPPPPDIYQKLNIPVNMNFQSVDVANILEYLAETTDTNIVMSSSVTEAKKEVNIKIKDMTLEDALRYVLKSAGFSYRIDKNVIWIATPQEIDNEQMETKIFTLKKGKGAFTKFTSTTTGGVGLGSAADVSDETTLEDILQKAVSWPSGSRLVMDERLSALIVTNTPYNLEIIEKILNKIDVEPIQVLIETRFLEVTVTDLSELGIDMQTNSEWPIDSSPGSGFVQGFAENAGSNFTNTTRQTEGFNFTYQGVLTKPQFQVVLHALDESQKVKTLSAPRVTTLDNQTATMKVVDEWIYPTRYEFQIVQNDANGDGDFNDANETQYKNVPADFVKRDVGILLRVTPSVGINDETITLTLIPEVSEGTAGYFSYTGDVTLPLFTSRNLSTSVVVNNGDTVVLGGLIKETQTKVETKVPILGDLPWLGALFRKDTDTTVRKNLLIFVTASILSSSGNQVVFSQVAKVEKE